MHVQPVRAYIGAADIFDRSVLEQQLKICLKYNYLQCTIIYIFLFILYKLLLNNC